AHKLSEGDTRYTWEETEERLDRLRGLTGATTCQHFHDKIDPTTCKKCSYWGEINSPYKLGITSQVEEGKDGETAWDYMSRLPGEVRRKLQFEYAGKGSNLYKSPSYINAEAMITVLGIKGSHDIFHDIKLITAPDGVAAKLGPKLSDAICRAVRRRSA